MQTGPGRLRALFQALGASRAYKGGAAPGRRMPARAGRSPAGGREPAARAAPPMRRGKQNRKKGQALGARSAKGLSHPLRGGQKLCFCPPRRGWLIPPAGYAGGGYAYYIKSTLRNILAFIPTFLYNNKHVGCAHCTCIGFCAIRYCEPCQIRKKAALSSSPYAPQ